MLMVDSVDEWVGCLLEEKRLAAQLTQGDIDARALFRKGNTRFLRNTTKNSGRKSGQMSDFTEDTITLRKRPR